MAERLVGESSLSASLRLIFDRMESPEIVDFIRGTKLNSSLWPRLKDVLSRINAFFLGAEEKLLLHSDFAQMWIDELQDVIYDADDIVDDIYTKTLQSKLEAEFETNSIKVRNCIPASLFVDKIERKLKMILEKLEDLSRQKDDMGLRESAVTNQSQRLPSSSFVYDSVIVGRDDEKQGIINYLLSDHDESINELDVIAIVGMGGIGKTTLAQLIYNDDRVNGHFDLKAWLTVSEEFDAYRVTKSVLESVTCPGSITDFGTLDLDQLQVRLREILMGKKFLIVLDDVCNKNYLDWILSAPFRSGAQGCKIIATTRDVVIASVMGARAIYSIKALQEEDCWSLFAKHAFHDGNANASPDLEILGRQIVKKCKGLPLAVRLLGALLSSDLDVHYWKSVLNGISRNWGFEQSEVLRALMSSYIDLPSNLKQCFAYCSLFPKDYVFEIHELVLLWMAEGFVDTSGREDFEEVGYDYFHNLTSRALFQPWSSDNSLFSMHDLVNDLANFISGPFNVNLEGEHPLEIGSKTRHFSYIGTRFDEFKKFKALFKAKKLRTFLAINMLPRHNKLAKEVLDDLLPMLSCLRVLSLSHYDNVTVLPKSIGKLKHLRYLNLSFTAIQSLPDSICKLCNLQTLKLLGCQYLPTLPRDMWKLVNLHYFDITGSAIKKMPINLGKLESLRALPSFIICKNIGSEISELGKLTNLQGKLSILELQELNMDYPDPNLRNIKSLKELVLEWNASDTNIDPESEKAVLERLEPCTNLKRLTIKCYRGEFFPDWVSLPSFSKLEVLHLYNCKHCGCLPPLGQLPFLLHLSIVGFDKIFSVGPEFCGSISSSSKPFGALKVLRFKQMLNLKELKKELFPSFTENEGGAFPLLEELCIDNCPELVLQGSRICGSSSPIDPPWSGLFSTLKTLDITFAEKFDLPMCLDYPMYPSLTRLLLTHCCDSLRSIKLELFPELSEIKICGLRNLESLSIPKHYKQELKTSEIDIRDCPYFVSFPKGGLHAPSLISLCIINCGSLRSLPDEMNKLLPSLEKLFIDDCPEVELAPEEGLPSSLYSISFNGFDKPIVGRSAKRLARLPTVGNLVTGGKLEDTESHQSSGL